MEFTNIKNIYYTKYNLPSDFNVKLYKKIKDL